jgi:hypothetical protein
MSCKACKFSEGWLNLMMDSQDTYGQLVVYVRLNGITPPAVSPDPAVRPHPEVFRFSSALWTSIPQQREYSICHAPFAAGLDAKRNQTFLLVLSRCPEI